MKVATHRRSDPWATARFALDSPLEEGGFEPSVPPWGQDLPTPALSRGGVRMMIGHCPDAMLPAQTGDHSYFAYLHVDDVDALHAEFVRRGAIIQQPPVDRPWGMREMAVATPVGHRMMIGQKI